MDELTKTILMWSGIVLAIVVLILFLVYLVIHIRHINKCKECNKIIMADEIDNIVLDSIDTSVYEKEVKYVYEKDNIPLGRAMAFLNYFGRSIYDEEALVFLCNRSSRDNEFREYGVIIARSGVYAATENPNNRDAREKDGLLKSKDKSISFVGLIKAKRIGKIIITVNINRGHFFEKIRLFRYDDIRLIQDVYNICTRIIELNIGEMFFNCGVYESFEDYQEQLSLSSDGYGSFDQFFDHAEGLIHGKAANDALQAAGVKAVDPLRNAKYDEVKHYMDGNQGHGYAAEYGNAAVDAFLGRDVKNLAQDLDEFGRQKKNGPDRMVNGVEIQTKYCRSAKETIDAAFDGGKARYIRTIDGSGKMMQIEVPRDQYRESLKIMQDKIDNGQVPNVKPSEDARNYVRKGFFTYEQACNIAKAGTIEGIGVDVVSGAVSSVYAAGISSVIVFADAMWHGANVKDAFKQCASAGLRIMGKNTFVYVLTMQLSRKEIVKLFGGKKVIANAVVYDGVKNPVYVLSEKIAAKISASALAKTSIGKKIGIDSINGRQLIGSAVTVIVVFGPDVLKALQGRISTKQLIKNAAVGAGGIAGAAAGQALIPIPVVGGIIGGIIGSLGTKMVLDQFIEDDAKEMFRILKEEFLDQIMLANLTKEEMNEVIELTVGDKKISKKLELMYKAKDSRNYAKIDIMQKSIETVIMKRTLIEQKNLNQGLIEMSKDIRG